MNLGLILMLTVPALLNRGCCLLRTGGRKGSRLQDRSRTKCLELWLLERVGHKL